MNASALNTAAIPTAGQAGPATAATTPGALATPLAGFEALLAALLPQGAAGGAPTVGALDAGKGSDDSKGSADGLPVDGLVANPAAGDPNAALMASVLAAPPVVADAVPASAAPQDTAPESAPAWGHEKAKGIPAAPAFANARTGPADKGELSAEVAPEQTDVAEATPVTDLPRAGKTASPPPPVAAPTSASAAPPAQAAAAPVSGDLADPAVIAQAAPAAEPAPAESAASETPAPALAASLLTRPEPTPAPAPRSRTERTRTVADPKGESDLQPLEAVDRPVHAKAAQGAAKAAFSTIEVADAKTGETEAQAESPENTPQAETRASAQGLTPAAHTTHGVRGSPETVANLAAQMIKKLDGKSTRFDIELNPDGLGKVDVRVEIGAGGRMTAAMTFDNPQAAADLKARSAELQRALEQAGFDMSGGLSFDVSGDGAQQQRQAWQDQADNRGQAFRGQAFRAALDTAGEAADAAINGALRLRRGVTAGLDMRI